MVYFTDSNSAGDFGLPTNVANLSAIVDLVSPSFIIFISNQLVFHYDGHFKSNKRSAKQFVFFVSFLRI